MIVFQPVKMIDCNLFIFPAKLGGCIQLTLEKSGIPYRGIYWQDIQLYASEEEIDKARELYKKAGWEESLLCMAGIFSKVQPEDLFHLSCKYFGSTMDPDWKAMLEESDRRDQQAYEAYYKNIPEGTIFVEDHFRER